MYVYMHVCMYVSMYLCMDGCMYACMHVCMYVCMHVCTVCVFCSTDCVLHVEYAACQTFGKSTRCKVGQAVLANDGVGQRKKCSSQSSVQRTCAFEGEVTDSSD